MNTLIITITCALPLITFLLGTMYGGHEARKEQKKEVAESITNPYQQGTLSHWKRKDNIEHVEKYAREKYEVELFELRHGQTRAWYAIALPHAKSWGMLSNKEQHKALAIYDKKYRRTYEAVQRQIREQKN